MLQDPRSPLFPFDLVQIFSYCYGRRIVAHLVNFQLNLMVNFPLRLLENMIFYSESNQNWIQPSKEIF